MSIFSDIWQSAFGKDSARKKKKDEEAQNEKIGNVALNAGDHGTIFGFNRNIIVGTGIAIFTITAIATIFAMDTEESSTRRVPDRQQQASTAQDGKHETGKIKGNSYEDLAKSESNFLGQGSGSNQVGRGKGTPTAQDAQARAQAPVPTAPAPVSVPAPVAVPAPAVAAAPAEDKEETEYMNRMKSAISFAANGNAFAGKEGQSGQSSNNAAASGSDGFSQYAQAGLPAQDSGGPFAAMSQTASPSGYSEVSYSAPGKYMLQAGTIIPVVLCTGIHSDIGGQVVAQVQQDMYDTATGRNLLIPAGSKILGTYGTGSPNNSGRVGITFSTIVLPDGGSFLVGNSLVAVDGAGYSGVSGKVNRHTGSVISAGMFSSALAALGSVAAGNTSNTSNTYSAGQLAMQGAMANMMNTASNLFQQGTNRQMTVTAAPGKMFSVYVTQGITLQRGNAR